MALQSSDAYAVGMSRSNAFDALPQAAEDSGSKRFPKITLRWAIFIFIWLMVQVTVLAVKIAQGKAAEKGSVFEGFNKGVEVLMMTSLSVNLLLMSPTFLKLLRNTALRRIVSFDKNTKVHKVIGYTLTVWILVHVFTHYYKFYQLEKKTQGKTKATDILYGGKTGQIGHSMLAIMVVVFFSAMPVVRRKFFEVFYLLHHLSFLIILLIFFHVQVHTVEYYVAAPIAIYLLDRAYRMVRSRINRPRILAVIQHPSNVIELRFERKGIYYKAGQYVYLCIPSLSWHQWHPFTLTSAPEEDELSVHIRASGGWTQKLVEMFQQCATVPPRYAQRPPHLRPDDKQRITSVDSERTLTPSYNQHVHGGPRSPRPVATRGRGGHHADDLRRQASGRGRGPPRYPPNIRQGESRGPETRVQRWVNDALPMAVSSTASLPTIMVDGPYCAVTQDVFDYNHIVLIGGNIGATPMSSVLKSLYYRLTTYRKTTTIRKVYFIWSCRDVQALEWFRDLLAALDGEGIGDILEIRTYLTGELSVDMIHNIALNQDVDGPDAVTGLYRSPTYYGRPNFDRIFGEIGQRNPSTEIGVFFCGSRPFARSLRKVVGRWNGELKHRGTKFAFHEEKSSV
ncbi:hypothetical protein GGF46_003961 [Coemansia sp. RSA 552]|nr:hypothetical protein GGF46_003961 [Coemansia sp. RSA 552]